MKTHAYVCPDSQTPTTPSISYPSRTTSTNNDTGAFKRNLSTINLKRNLSALDLFTSLLAVSSDEDKGHDRIDRFVSKCFIYRQIF
jgi:hypothetical protein